jgi:hypothetical protein
MCGNPRKFFNERTMQEQRLMQDMDQQSRHHKNGTVSEDE